MSEIFSRSPLSVFNDLKRGTRFLLNLKESEAIFMLTKKRNFNDSFNMTKFNYVKES